MSYYRWAYELPAVVATGRDAAFLMAATQSSAVFDDVAARLYTFADLGCDTMKGKYSTSPIFVGLITSTLHPVRSILFLGLMSSLSI